MVMSEDRRGSIAVVVVVMVLVVVAMVLVMVTQTVLWGRIVVVATMVDHTLVHITTASGEEAHRTEAGTW